MTSSVAPPRSDALIDREQAELIRALYRNLPAGALVMLFGVIVSCAGMLYMAPERRPQVFAWFALSLAIGAGQLGLWAWRRAARDVDADWRAWRRRLIAACVADGTRWAIATLWLAGPGEAEQQVWICMICGGAVCASVASWGIYAPVYYAMMFPAMVPYIVWAAFIPDPRYWGVAALGGLLTVAIAWLSHRQSRTFAEAVRLRFENLDLAESLRKQKELAEQADLAKTRFLAAASHDLRQPMHALGMFVAALGRSRLARADSRLVSQIAEAVEAMDGLFGSLLDISQLDAGLVRPEPRAFAIQPLLVRICREQEPQLRDGSVILRSVGSGAVIHADPILLERMLRNLISNAARHTRAGRILVGCRRRGDRLWVEVRDTGPGIPPELQTQIFEEYYQIGNPERDRTKGLGLGLAITRRLAALLDCPLTLWSEPGRGSMFRVAVPLAADPAPAPAADLAGAGLAQAGRVFVVDDETLVQDSTARLLSSWGYEVLTGGSAAEVLSRAGGLAPDLIICDWRLRGEETAPAAIEEIRRAHAAQTPALLITGDIAPAQLRAAHAMGLPLLHKPVAPGRLRAAIGNLLRAAV